MTNSPESAKFVSITERKILKPKNQNALKRPVTYHQFSGPSGGTIRSQGKNWSFRSGIGIDIKFGMPKYGCRFHGICKLDIDESDFAGSSPIYGKAKGWLIVPQAAFCWIGFEKRSLTVATRSAHFVSSYFLLEEAAPFTERLNGVIGRKCSLKPGKYRLQDRKDRFGILFDLQIAPIIFTNGYPNEEQSIFDGPT